MYKRNKMVDKYLSVFGNQTFNPMQHAVNLFAHCMYSNVKLMALLIVLDTNHIRHKGLR